MKRLNWSSFLHRGWAGRSSSSSLCYRSLWKRLSLKTFILWRITLLPREQNRTRTEPDPELNQNQNRTRTKTRTEPDPEQNQKSGSDASSADMDLKFITIFCSVIIMIRIKTLFIICMLGNYGCVIVIATHTEILLKNLSIWNKIKQVRL